MQRRSFCAAALLAAVPSRTGAQGGPPLTSLDADLVPYLARFALPALAAGVVKDGKVVAAGVAGVRRIGTTIPVTLQDRFHIGSDTKAMTALLAAILVEEGKLRWATTVGEIYPELLATMAPGVKDITVEQLLSHTSGLPAEREEHLPLFGLSLTDDAANLDAMRASLVRRLLPQPLATPPGTRFEYSNLGYTLAGAMMERLTGRSWEELIASRLFDPLQLGSAGFGPQSSPGRVDAPLGHATDKDGKLVAFMAGPWADNPPILGPAGTAHMSVLDFARWAAWNATLGRIGPALVKPETVAKLQTGIVDMPPQADPRVSRPSYGLGWVGLTLSFAAEPLVFHAGSNNMNLAFILLQPARQFGLVLMTNVGGPKANDALMTLAAALYGKFAR